MFDQRLHEVMDPTDCLLVTPDSPVAETARRMTTHGVTAALVTEAGRLIGIFTATDALRRVVAAGLDPQSTAVSQVMTRAPLSLPPQRRFGTALALMQERGIEQIPVVEEGRPVGLVRSRMALDPELEDFVVESSRRTRFALTD